MVPDSASLIKGSILSSITFSYSFELSEFAQFLKDGKLKPSSRAWNTFSHPS